MPTAISPILMGLADAFRAARDALGVDGGGFGPDILRSATLGSLALAAGESTPSVASAAASVTAAASSAASTTAEATATAAAAAGAVTVANATAAAVFAGTTTATSINITALFESSAAMQTLMLLPPGVKMMALVAAFYLAMILIGLVAGWWFGGSCAGCVSQRAQASPSQSTPQTPVARHNTARHSRLNVGPDTVVAGSTKLTLDAALTKTTASTADSFGKADFSASSASSPQKQGSGDAAAVAETLQDLTLMWRGLRDLRSEMIKDEVHAIETRLNVVETVQRDILAAVEKSHSNISACLQASHNNLGARMHRFHGALLTSTAEVLEAVETLGTNTIEGGDDEGGEDDCNGGEDDNGEDEGSSKDTAEETGKTVEEKEAEGNTAPATATTTATTTSTSLSSSSSPSTLPSASPVRRVMIIQDTASSSSSSSSDEDHDAEEDSEEAEDDDSEDEEDAEEDDGEDDGEEEDGEEEDEEDEGMDEVQRHALAALMQGNRDICDQLARHMNRNALELATSMSCRKRRPVCVTDAGAGSAASGDTGDAGGTTSKQTSRHRRRAAKRAAAAAAADAART